MLKVSYNGSIYLTRGDSATIKINLKNKDTNRVHVLDPMDKLTFTVKKSTKDTNHLFQIVVFGESVFHILQDHTKDLEFGDYVYDVQLDTVDNDTITVIEKSAFVVGEEVT